MKTSPNYSVLMAPIKRAHLPRCAVPMEVLVAKMSICKWIINGFIQLKLTHLCLQQSTLLCNIGNHTGTASGQHCGRHKSIQSLVYKESKEGSPPNSRWNAHSIFAQEKSTCKPSESHLSQSDPFQRQSCLINWYNDTNSILHNWCDK